jgi:single-strand DNA-binding protein
MLNKSILQGRLVADPELKHTNSDIAVANFTLAVDRSYTKQGEEKQADFIKIICWRQTAEFASKYFRKGQLVLVEGAIQTGNYTDNEGKKRYTTDVVASNVYFCGSKSDKPSTTGIDEIAKNASDAGVPVGVDFVEIDDSDDLPF